MANQLDDISGPVMKDGRDINVIAQKIPVKVGAGSAIFEICLWLCAVPGLVLMIMSLGGGLSLPWYVGLIVFAAGVAIPPVYFL